jgi:hypothetical protein
MPARHHSDAAKSQTLSYVPKRESAASPAAVQNACVGGQRCEKQCVRSIWGDGVALIDDNDMYTALRRLHSRLPMHCL